MEGIERVLEALGGIEQARRDRNQDRLNDAERNNWDAFLRMRQNVVTGVNILAPAPGAVVGR
jgi:hypothetical protein